jgi:hypothetical protein
MRAGRFIGGRWLGCFGAVMDKVDLGGNRARIGSRNEQRVELLSAPASGLLVEGEGSAEHQFSLTHGITLFPKDREPQFHTARSLVFEAFCFRPDRAIGCDDRAGGIGQDMLHSRH